MKSLWSQDKFFKAFNYAAQAHIGQKIPGSEIPYITHVACVCAELMAVIDENVNGDLVIQCGALHDTIEDTKTTHEYLLQEFGKDVAEGVSALSKNNSLDKPIRVEESINRILLQPKEIWMVKMADRITNLNPPPDFWTSERKLAYYEQSKLIYDRLKTGDEVLSQRLNEKIEEYRYYI